MLVIDGWTRVKIMAYSEKMSRLLLATGSQGPLGRSWLQDHRKVVTGRRPLAIYYNSLRRFSSKQMNLTSIAHLLELSSYQALLDKYMKEFVE